MIVRVIQGRFLKAGDFPTASAISFVLMAMITTAVLDLREVPRNGGPGMNDVVEPVLEGDLPAVHAQVTA